MEVGYGPELHVHVGIVMASPGNLIHTSARWGLPTPLSVILAGPGLQPLQYEPTVTGVGGRGGGSVTRHLNLSIGRTAQVWTQDGWRKERRHDLL